LRRAIFCEEQGLFEVTDEDEWDPVAYPIVAVATQRTRAPVDEAVIGVVRIYEASPGLWYGGRLAVLPGHRKHGVVGRGLVREAVTLARGWGCGQFLALVQETNVPFFEGLGWRALEARLHWGRPHRLMEADLALYPPACVPRPALTEVAP